eukprot:TRINITY_DN1033_c0_g1::TRINITY_DN1033_c0_g1_i1::g.30006::m.30006 TRINITY_DN1033_c0_g1::TRINITY_DN1033_c0_g1_i1::g.30006  ORF type:complete len:2241 (+),score=612.32,sp/Q54T82/Y1931_DICDI/26.07/8e-75,sp/Q54T82/Y1931_DICDI/22.35/4e-15,LRR_8/PF13855.1/4.5e+03,LRR_8/PF13855.1/20,LRR_8/PF13855.1/0.11,LRR_8/PF13855.1/7.3e-05,LRR_8/PF13855.1/6.6e+03,LRR_8/PF13855.1/87,LRR_8/PF13855.1/26,LRR_8/PF13855.1/2.9e-05,LRR_8/PF13855.1/0.0011,LRR_4/PF12799.2/7.9e+03,LRR_4/PF12799.2/0.039,LRR_4/PF12799.2/0.15,LRR_
MSFSRISLCLVFLLLASIFVTAYSREQDLHSRRHQTHRTKSSHSHKHARESRPQLGHVGPQLNTTGRYTPNDFKIFGPKISKHNHTERASSEKPDPSEGYPYNLGFYYSLCSPYLTYPFNIDEIDGEVYSPFSLAEIDAWTFQFNVIWSSSYMFTPPRCEDAWKRFLCTQYFPKSTVLYPEIDGDDIQWGPARPQCRSMCTDVMQQCRADNDLWGGLLSNSSLYMFCVAKNNPNSFCTLYLTLARMILNSQLNNALLADSVNITTISELLDMVDTFDTTRSYNGYMGDNQQSIPDDFDMDDIWCSAFPDDKDEQCFWTTEGDEKLPGSVIVSLTTDFTTSTSSLLLSDSEITTLSDAVHSMFESISSQTIVHRRLSISNSVVTVKATLSPRRYASVPYLTTKLITSTYEASDTDDLVSALSDLSDLSCSSSSCGITGLSVDDTTYKSPIPDAETKALNNLATTCDYTGWSDNYGWSTSTDADACARYGVSCVSCSSWMCSKSKYSYSDCATVDYTYPSPQGFWCTSCSDYACDFESEWPISSNVLKIDLNQNNMVCDSLPFDFSTFTGLKTLNLGENNLASLQGWQLSEDEQVFPSSLTTLILSETGMVGSIPDWFENLQSLVLLNMGSRTQPFSYFARGLYLPSLSNQIEGSPSVLGSIPSLKYLNLAYNTLSDAFPEEFCQLTSLVDLNMDGSGNEVDTFIIPDCVGDMQALSYLAYMASGLSGSIPESMGTLSNLHNVFMPSNSLSGTVPESVWCNYPFMQEFIIAENKLVGTVPECIGDLGMYNYPVGILVFSIYSNQFTGSLPDTIGNHPSMWFISVSNQALTGTIPKTLSKVTGMNQFYWEYTSVNDTWPTFLYNMAVNLNVLKLTGNNLRGTVPALTEAHWNCTDPNAWGCFYGLEQIGAADNELDGTLPDFSKFISLNWISFSENNLTSIVPNPVEDEEPAADNVVYSFCNNPLMTFVDVSFNDIADPLSDCLSRANLKFINRLNFQHNQFYGTLPESLATATTLQYLMLSFNLITGSIPSSFSDLSDLRGIDFSLNQLTGNLGDDFFSPLKNLVNLGEVNLASNNITGTLRYQDISAGSTFYWPSLHTLVLSNNDLSGALLPVVADLATLRNLDISGNGFVGTVPDGFKKLSTLRVDENNMGCTSGISLYCKEEFLSFLKPIAPYLRSTSGEFSCPSWTSLFNDAAVIAIDPSYYNYTFCKCDIGYYGSHGSCQLCVEGGNCEMSYVVQVDANGEETILGDDLLLLDPPFENVYVKNPLLVSPGYYPSPYSMYKESKNFNALVPCYPESLSSTMCNPTSETVFECAEGYNADSHLCSKCENGYYLQGRSCTPCPSQGISQFILCFVVIGLFLFFFMLFVKHERFLHCDDTLKSFCFYTQFVSVIFSGIGLAFPDSCQIFVEMYSYFNLSLSILWCASSNTVPGDTETFVHLMLLPLYLSLIAFVYSTYYYFKWSWVDKTPERCKMLPYLAVHFVGFAVNYMYLPIALKIMTIFQCEHDDGDGKDYSTYYPWLECDPEGRWGSMKNAAGALIPFYVVGIPGLFAFAVYRNRNRLTDPKVMTMFSFLYSSYKPQFYWFELATVIRRLFMSVTVTANNGTSANPSFFIFLILGASCLMQAYFNPFPSMLYNGLEAMAMVTVCSTFVCGLLLQVIEEGSVFDAIETLIIVINATTCGVFGVLGLRALLMSHHLKDRTARMVKAVVTCGGHRREMQASDEDLPLTNKDLKDLTPWDEEHGPTPGGAGSDSMATVKEALPMPIVGASTNGNGHVELKYLAPAMPFSTAAASLAPAGPATTFPLPVVHKTDGAYVCPNEQDPLLLLQHALGYLGSKGVPPLCSQIAGRRDMLDQLIKEILKFSQGMKRGKNRYHVLISGLRGVGKSQVLANLAQAVPLLCPDVRSLVYDMSVPASPCKLIITALPPDRKPSSADADSVVAALEKANMRILLCLDEMQAACAVDDEHIRVVMGELCQILSHKSGRIMVLATGTSGFLADVLFRHDLSAPISAKYPARFPSLNDSKMREASILPALKPEDLKTLLDCIHPTWRTDLDTMHITLDTVFVLTGGIASQIELLFDNGVDEYINDQADREVTHEEASIYSRMMLNVRERKNTEDLPGMATNPNSKAVTPESRLRRLLHELDPFSLNVIPSAADTQSMLLEDNLIVHDKYDNVLRPAVPLRVFIAEATDAADHLADDTDFNKPTPSGRMKRRTLWSSAKTLVRTQLMVSDAVEIL